MNGQCTAATTPTARAPFNAPLSAALLNERRFAGRKRRYRHPSGQRRDQPPVEVSPVLPGGFVGNPLQLDTPAPGALFRLATAVDADGNQIIDFNDDNAAAVHQ